MIWLCRACFRIEHEHCDPLNYWCECPCWTGELLDPLRTPEQRTQGEP